MLPIKKPTEKQKKYITSLVNKIIDLKKSLLKYEDKKTTETRKIEEEIENKTAKINEEVYKLYGLTDSKIKIVEEGLK